MMIRINLLPAREAKRRLEVRHQLQALVVVLVLTLGAGVWGYTLQNAAIEQRQQEVARLDAEVKRLEEVIKEVRKFENQKSVMEKKVTAIEEIKLSQRRPARLLDEISASLPDKMWLQSIKDAGGGLQIVGKSFDNVDIAAFMENLERSPSFSSVELVESKAELVQGRPVVAFTVIARIGAPNAKKKEATS